ncbi:iron ABC transporter permease [Plasticicumulans sp.]|uniref:FecCD family ABC transporter permease n=1 Tax=Plasticicumulans sp. TaxID=2307179 RepID=UPI00321FA2DF
MNRSPLRICAALVLAALAAFALAAASGSTPIPLARLPAALAGDGPAALIVRELRLPRAFAAFVTGGLLALAGALMQVLLRNPLADPYVLGLSGGAAVGALTVLLAGLAGVWVDAGAAAGALAAVVLVFGLAHGREAWSPLRLLLTGVVTAAGWSALIALLLALAPDRALRGMVFWLLGDLSAAARLAPAALTLAFGLGAALLLAPRLNVLMHGELAAASLGVAVRPLRLALYALASLCAAAAVTVAGPVGFVGLVVPHGVRLAAGSDHRLLLPASALAGGTLLVLADTLARTAIAPQQLPLGAVTALVGVPAFLWLLNRGRHGG